ncbi:MAG: HNH endonuclease [Boseongicola sp. SB0670_bin_30]|nr:HNH endonuclease [Boseongicola sp. SB0670_bin_30]
MTLLAPRPPASHDNEGKTIVRDEHQALEESGADGICGLCGTALTGENSSREHIIPNAIGGRKRVSNFLCTPCNSTTGSEWDDELVRQLTPLCTMLNVKRSRGRNRSFVVETVSDRKLTLDSDGTMGIADPLFEAHELAGKTTVQIRARTMRELKGMLSGLKKKHPQLDVDEVMKQAEPVQEYSDEPYAIPLSVGGAVAGRSMVKSCLAMVHDVGLTTDQCEEAKHYLLSGGKPCFGFYTKRDLVRNRPEKTFFHCVHVQGDPERRQILAYVEYFGCLRFVAWLSRDYKGCAFSHCYTVDPVTGKELDLDIVLDIDPADLAEIDDGGAVDYGEVARALGVLVGAWKEMDVERARTHAIDDAIAFACAECGVSEGDILSDEQAAQFARLVSGRMTPYLMHTILASRLTEDDRRVIQQKLKESRTEPGSV